MITVKRYNPDAAMSISREHAWMRETPEGGHVEYGDYASLFAQFESVKAERDAARNAIAAIYKALTGECPEWSNWHAYLDDIVEEVGAAIAANQTADALAVENAALKDVFGSGEAVVNFLSIALRHTKYDCIDLPDVALAFKMSLPETPATDAALAAIQARILPPNIAEIIDSGDLETICYGHEHPFAERIRLALYNFRQLREAK